jgi:hypothetical protein
MTENSTQVNAPANATNVAYSPVTFNFRAKSAGEKKRESLELQLPFITLEGLIAIINEGEPRQVSLLLETLRTPVLEQAKAQVDEDAAITQDTLDVAKLTWAEISRLEPAARRGGGIPKEIWEAFTADYLEVMPAATQRSIERITVAAAMLGNKLSSCKGNKPVLKFLREQLDVYFASTTKAEEFVGCYEFLTNKADTLLKADDAELLKNLV